MLKSKKDSFSFVQLNNHKKNKPFRDLDCEHYDQFKGQLIEIQPQEKSERKEDTVKLNFQNFQEENSRNKSIFHHIKQSQGKVRKVGDQRSKKVQMKEKKQRKEEEKIEHQVKIEQTEIKEEKIPKKEKKNKKVVSGNSNWSSFLSKKDQNQHINKNSQKSQAVSLDCQFVKSNDEEILARISIVDQEGQCLLDSFVKPSKKVTDFVTQISGITYTHVKNAPEFQNVIQKAKKILYNKILVGHTINKDLSVCRLQEWKGWKSLVDVAEYPAYKEKNGKLISLRNLSMKHLGRSIQGDRHSSVEDATATMDLYLLNRKAILSHFKII